MQVGKACKQAELERSKLRQEKMIREKCRRDALVKRAAKEKEKLSKLHLITSADELKTTLSEIEEENISNTKEIQKKIAVIREQINIRKKVLRQKINVPFTTKGNRDHYQILSKISLHIYSLM